jgi:hypothetical protein
MAQIVNVKGRSQSNYCAVAMPQGSLMWQARVSCDQNELEILCLKDPVYCVQAVTHGSCYGEEQKAGRKGLP